MPDFPRSVLEFQRHFPDEAACAAWLSTFGELLDFCRRDRIKRGTGLIHQQHLRIDAMSRAMHSRC